MKRWSSQLWTQFLQLRKEVWKSQDFNGIWTRHFAIPVRRSNQLSYEPTDVGSWSFVRSNVPVRNEPTMKWYMKWIIYELRIWNQVKLWSSQLWTQFLQLRKEVWKIQDFNGFEPVTSRYRRDALTNWGMKPPTLGAGHLWVPMFPWGMNQRWNDIWNGSYMNCGYEIKWSYDPRSYESNFCNCVKRLHLISYPQFIYDPFHISFHR